MQNIDVTIDIYYGLKAFQTLARAIDASQAKMAGRAFVSLEVTPETTVDELGNTLEFILGREATTEFSHVFFAAQAYAEKTYELYLVDTTNWTLPSARLFLNLYTRPYKARPGTPSHPRGYDKRVNLDSVPDLDQYIAITANDFSFDEFQNELDTIDYDEEEMVADPLFRAEVERDAELYGDDIDDDVEESEQVSFAREEGASC
jgi:hypothetical protein